MPWIKDVNGKWVDVPGGSGGGSVTKTKIVAALGYTPANQTEVDTVKESIKTLEDVIKELQKVLQNTNDV